AAPCAYLALPCRHGFPRFFEGTYEHLHRLTFGDVSGGLPRVWQSRPGRSFRSAFSRRHQWGQVGYLLDATLSPSAAPPAPPPPPAPCRRCYKLYGA
ncbi:MAG: hypothetical protein QME93_04905, partial [Bacillota bacterium]|nr:hypothetical protein [Bacillota bacterium]